MRDDQLLSQVPLRANNVDDIETLPQSSVERIMQLQMKQMQVMQSLTKQFHWFPQIHHKILTSHSLTH
jgi:hypothetical protein